MKFSHHMLVHFLLATIASYLSYFLFRSLGAAAVCFCASIFPDFDHLIDYWLVDGFNLNAAEFWRQTLKEKENYFARSGKVRLFFHAWELIPVVAAAGLVFGKLPWAVGFALGYGAHLMWDQVNFGKRLWSYSFIFRAKHKFELKDLVGRKY